MRILLLGGTAQAGELVGSLDAAGIEVITSVAGRTRQARESAGGRVGGFGGVEGMCAYLRDPETRPDAVIDATHPFAAQITSNAAAACEQSGIPLLRLSRPGWAGHPRAGDWTWVASHAEAAQAAAAVGGRVLLTVGRQPLPGYRALGDVLARVAEWQPAEIPANWRILEARGPFTLDAEIELLRSEQIACVVSKDSGGAHTAAKLDAAHSLDIPVVMIRRPATPAGVTEVANQEEVLAWLQRL